MRGFSIAAAASVALCLLMVESSAVVKEAQQNRILFLVPIGARSQKNFYTGVANALADHGNHVTIVSQYKPSKQRDNVREVVLSRFDIMSKLPNLFQKGTGGMHVILTFSMENCNEMLATEEVQSLLKEKFDVIILSAILSDCFLAVVHHLKVPFIYISPIGLLGPASQWAGSPSFPSIMSIPLLEAKHPLNFGQRAASTLLDTAMNLMMTRYASPRLEAICREKGLCPDDMPSFNELRYNSSLVLFNSVKTLDIPPQPLMPSVIPIGGIHCHPAKPLPKELEEWVQGAGEHGFIFFSLGTAVKPSDMPEEYRKIIVKVLGSLKQRVLWKWDQDTMPDLPPNVRLGKYLPQQDILGHPSLRLFITHGGLLSTMESMYHGTAVLGLPVMGDQQANMGQVVREGWGQVINWADLTEDTFRRGIHTVMTDESMRAEAQRRSRVMRDQPLNPRDVAVYWVEYVIRHKGAPHLRSPFTTMSWYQIYNTDVWVTLLVVVVLVDYLLLKLLFSMCSRFFSSKGNKGKKKRE